jgi:hypothetical protein
MIVHVKNLFFYSKIKYIFEPPYTFFLFEYKLEMFFFLKKKGQRIPSHHEDSESWELQGNR